MKGQKQIQFELLQQQNKLIIAEHQSNIKRKERIKKTPIDTEVKLMQKSDIFLNKMILSGTSQNQSCLQIFDLIEQKIEQTFITAPYDIEAIDNCEYLISLGLNNGKMLLYDYRLKRNIANREICLSQIRSVKINKKNPKLYSLAFQDKIAYFDHKRMDTINSTLGHDWSNDGKLLYSGGLDQVIKSWTQELEEVSAIKVPNSIQQIECYQQNGQEMVAISGLANKDFISFWSAPNFYKPLYTIKPQTDSPIFKFDCDIENEIIYLGTKDKKDPIKILPIFQFKEDYHINTSISVDQTDKIAFSFGKQKDDSLTTFNIYDSTQHSNVFNFDNYFQSISQELIQYREILRKEIVMDINEKKRGSSLDYGNLSIQQDMLQAELNKNNNKKQIQYMNKQKTISQDQNKVIYKLQELISFTKRTQNEVSQKIQFVLQLYETYQKSKRRQSKALVQKINDQNLIDYIKENYQNFQKLIKQKQIQIDNSKIIIQKSLYDSIKKREEMLQYDFLALNQNFFSLIVIQTIRNLINQGSLVGFILYLIIKDQIQIEEEEGKEIELQFIQILRDQDLHVFATEIIKKSKYECVNEKNNNNTKYKIRCAFCHSELQNFQNGECSKCQSIVTCDICGLQVKSLSIFCTLCGHGGHMQEVLEYFNEKNKDVFCPQGCNHRCFNFNQICYQIINVIIIMKEIEFLKLENEKLRQKNEQLMALNQKLQHRIQHQEQEEQLFNDIMGALQTNKKDNSEQQEELSKIKYIKKRQKESLQEIKHLIIRGELKLLKKDEKIRI